MRHRFAVTVGPVSFRVGSAWRAPIESLRALYHGYPAAPEPARYTVRLEPERPWRRFVRPSVRIAGDHTLPDSAPMALAHGLLAAEMGMNLQLALGERRHLLLHAGWVERGGRAVVLTGHSGSGKSTLTALLAAAGWRFGGDELALLDPADGRLRPFPRPISLKNAGVAALGADPWPGARWGPLLTGTPKGTLRHLAPPPDAVARMDEGARPALLLFPAFGHPTAVRPVGRDEAFVRLTQASTNYVALGRAGFDALTRFVAQVPALAIDFATGAEGVAQVERLMAEAGA